MNDYKAGVKAWICSENSIFMHDPHITHLACHSAKTSTVSNKEREGQREGLAGKAECEL